MKDRFEIIVVRLQTDAAAFVSTCKRCKPFGIEAGLTQGRLNGRYLPPVISDCGDLSGDAFSLASSRICFPGLGLEGKPACARRGCSIMTRP